MAQPRAFRPATLMLLALFATLASASGCVGAQSCTIASNLRENPDFDSNLSKLRALTTVAEGEAICWRQAPLTLTDADGHRNQIPIEYGWDFQAKEAREDAPLFHELSLFARGVNPSLSSEAQILERFVRPGDGSHVMPTEEMRALARSRLAIYNAHETLASAGEAVQQFCAQVKLMKSNPALAAGANARSRFLSLRNGAAAWATALKANFSSPDIAAAKQAACSERGTGQNSDPRRSEAAATGQGMNPFSPPPPSGGASVPAVAASAF